MVIDLILQFLVRFGSVCHFLTDFTSHTVELAGMVIDLILQFLVRFGSVCYFLTNLSSYTVNLALLIFIYFFHSIQTSFMCIQFLLLVIDLFLLTFVHMFNSIQTSFMCIQFLLLVIDLLLLTFVHMFNAVQTIIPPSSIGGHPAQGKKDGAGEERGEDGALQRTAGRGLCASHRVIAVNELGAHHVAAARGVPYDFVDLIHTAYPFPCVYTSLVFGLRTEICPRPFFHPTPNRRYIYIL